MYLRESYLTNVYTMNDSPSVCVHRANVQTYSEPCWYLQFISILNFSSQVGFLNYVNGVHAGTINKLRYFVDGVYCATVIERILKYWVIVEPGDRCIFILQSDLQSLKQKIGMRCWSGRDIVIHEKWNVVTWSLIRQYNLIKY